MGTSPALAWANLVKVARRYVANLLAEVAQIDPDHVDDVVLAVSELVTNAIRHAVGEGNWSSAWPSGPSGRICTSLTRIPTVPTPVTISDADLSLSGRGVPIVGEQGQVFAAYEGMLFTNHP